MPDVAPPSPRPPKPRRVVEPEKLKEDIALALKMLRGRVLRDRAAGEAFALIASLVVDEFVRRGFEVTAPPPTEMHSWPPTPRSPYPLKD